MKSMHLSELVSINDVIKANLRKLKEAKGFTHEQLGDKKNGIYAELFAAQAQYYIEAT
mgnify:CR=1 FL=1